jgi:phosphatidylglycerophosphate synthase
MAIDQGPEHLPAVFTGLAASLLLQNGFIWAVRRHIGAEDTSAADLLTICRASIGALLAALCVTGFHTRLSLVGWMAWGLALAGATALDWLDGPLARHLGPTKLGSVLDIEADSWLTLWCATGAVAWADLAWWCLLPPVVRYLAPVRALFHGRLPEGGGPWWSRVTGTAQMALLLGALAPVTWPGRDALLLAVAIPISGAQLVAMLWSLTAR